MSENLVSEEQFRQDFLKKFDKKHLQAINEYGI